MGKCLYMDVDFDGHAIGNKHFWIRWYRVKEAGGKYVTMQEEESLMSSYSRYSKHFSVPSVQTSLIHNC